VLDGGTFADSWLITSVSTCTDDISDAYHSRSGHYVAPRYSLKSYGSTYLASDDEIHAVTCCSDNSIANWTLHTSCSVYTESDATWDCQWLNYDDADEFCTSVGGR
jgi:hypothetical protein